MNKFIKSKLTAIEKYVNRTYIIGNLLKSTYLTQM